MHSYHLTAEEPQGLRHPGCRLPVEDGVAHGTTLGEGVILGENDVEIWHPQKIRILPFKGKQMNLFN